MSGKRFAWIAAAALLLVCVAGSCERRELEVLYRESIRVVIKTRWEVNAYPAGEKPTGITLYLFRNGEFYNRITTANVDSCEVELGVGHYNVYAISQSPEEYATYTFEDMTSLDKASVSLVERPSDWATRMDDEPVVQDPETLLAGVAEDFDITDEMVEDYQYYYTDYMERKDALERAATKAASKADLQALEELEEKVRYYSLHIPISPRNIVSQYWVTIYAAKADNLMALRASTSGMARRFGLTLGDTRDGRCTQVITQWSLKMDSAEDRIGHVDGIITTLGLPDGQIPGPQRDSTLNVTALLIDNATTADYVFNVGDKIRRLDPNPGYRHLYRLVFGAADKPAIEIPEVDPQPQNEGGGFTAGVADWDEEIHAEIPI